MASDSEYGCYILLTINNPHTISKLLLVCVHSSGCAKEGGFDRREFERTTEAGKGQQGGTQDAGGQLITTQCFTEQC